MTLPRLIQSYDDAVAAILSEVRLAQSGDWVRLSVWILEPGETSEELLSELVAAAERGAEVLVSVDGTNASLVQRLWERTVTLLPRVRRLAREVERLSCVERREPDHSKYAIFRSRSRPTVAIWGGVNLGDRFRPWRDFVVRLVGSDAEAVALKVLGEDADFTYPPAEVGLTPVANVPSSARFEILPAFRALVTDPSVTRIRFAMAYLDRTGVNEVLRPALEAGVEVEFLLPGLANVYQDSNFMALETILPEPGFRAFACPEMLHAKVALAYAGDELDCAFFGSANLKRYSLRYLGELNAFARGIPLAYELEAATAALFAESEPIELPIRYWRLKAIVEERLG